MNNFTSSTNQTEYFEKETFVNTYVEPMLIKANIGVITVKYAHENGDETVKVRLETKFVDINVTGDNLLAMLYDVVKRLMKE